MLRRIEAFGDRLLELVVPKARAEAAGCASCDGRGTICHVECAGRNLQVYCRVPDGQPGTDPCVYRKSCHNGACDS
jgi:hypothetical protein